MTHRSVPPVDCDKCGKIHERCRSHKSAGVPCGRWPRRGTEVCDSHGGKAPQVRTRAAVRAELMGWGLGDTTVDPGETLLRLVTQSAARCEFYAGLLRDAFDAAERLRLAQEAPESDLLGAATARLDLERTFNTGGVSVLIGHTYAGTQTSGVIATGEAIRGLAKLEADERDRCANFATKAVAAGLAERQVRLAERQGAMVLAIIAETLRALGHDPSAPQVRALISAEIARQTGVSPPAEDGVAMLKT